MWHKLNRMILAATVVLLTAGMALAITIDMVPVGNINNASDPATGHLYGSVDYAYNISNCEISAGQYVEFLNSVGAPPSDTRGLYNSAMANTSYGSPITYNSSTNTYTASLPSQPVNYVSWGDAARFCNWLQTGTTETGAYSLGGHTDSAYLMTVTRNAGATYVIPTENEWYKAAYYDPNKSGGSGYWLYPTKSNDAPSNVYPSSSTNNANYYNSGFTLGSTPYTTPVGSFSNSLSAYGTLDQGGNVWEWNETAIGSSRVFRGGTFDYYENYLRASFRSAIYPTDEYSTLGFRVASVPEPGSLAMLAGIALTALVHWWRKRAFSLCRRFTPAAVLGCVTIAVVSAASLPVSGETMATLSGVTNCWISASAGQVELQDNDNRSDSWQGSIRTLNIEPYSSLAADGAFASYRFSGSAIWDSPYEGTLSVSGSWAETSNLPDGAVRYIGGHLFFDYEFTAETTGDFRLDYDRTSINQMGGGSVEGAFTASFDGLFVFGGANTYGTMIVPVTIGNTYTLHLEHNGEDVMGSLSDYYSGSTTGMYHWQLPNPIPEPSTLVLFSIGAMSLLGYGWRRRGGFYSSFKGGLR